MSDRNTPEAEAPNHESHTQGDESVEHEMRRRSRRGFLLGGVALASGFAGWKWLNTRPLEDGVPWPFRRMFSANQLITQSYFSNYHVVPTYSLSEASIPRANGDYGLPAFDPDEWRLMVIGLEDSSSANMMVMPRPAMPQPAPKDMLTPVPPDNKKGGAAPPPRTPPQRQEAAVSFGLDAITGLDRFDLTTELKCIEGWSNVVHWTGARLADFIAKYPTKMINGKMPEYVGIETPDGAYYVGLDMQSALHPQTLLCYEMNGQPLTPEHGAPLRLVIPVKYGIKNLKRIGLIRFTNERPDDYWAKVGYDWYSGH